MREARRNDSARIVGPALASLRDIEPGPNIGALRGNPRATDALKEKWAAWLKAAGELEVLGATHPNSQVDNRCQSVITKGTQLLTGIHAAITGGGALPQAEWDRLNRLHADAVADGRRLVKDVLDQAASYAPKRPSSAPPDSTPTTQSLADCATDMSTAILFAPDSVEQALVKLPTVSTLIPNPHHEGEDSESVPGCPAEDAPRAIAVDREHALQPPR